MKSGSDKSGSAMKSEKPGKMAGGNAEQVKAVQQALKDKGHDPGEVDGKMGPKTQQALRDYQQKEGLKATGRLDTETAAKLGVQAKADAASSSSSPAASPSGSSSSSSSSPSGASSSATSPSGSSSSSMPSGSSSTGGASGSSSTGAKPATK
ncbi:MAG TPA: peptidoglycan-binding domain-containing protein [Methylomirabilota bacterium]|jgi:peptidoglycan hydrolase-like protein with peptidoglycan-binding domain